MIISHDHICYQRRWRDAGKNRFNGAYYYSLEIVKNIIPRVKTTRNWVTVNIPVMNHEPQFYKCCADHSIVFIHNNLHPENYEWLKKYNDLILVCGVPETCSKMGRVGRPVYLPLSVDVAEVKKHKKTKTKGRAFVGRMSKLFGAALPSDTDIIAGLPRAELLDKMAEYEEVYAVGRVAVEAKILGCDVLPYDPRYPDTELWQILDNKDAAALLQEEIDRIDEVRR